MRGEPLVLVVNSVERHIIRGVLREGIMSGQAYCRGFWRATKGHFVVFCMGVYWYC